MRKRRRKERSATRRRKETQAAEARASASGVGRRRKISRSWSWPREDMVVVAAVVVAVVGVVVVPSAATEMVLDLFALVVAAVAGCKQLCTGDRGWNRAGDKQRALDKQRGLNPAFELGLGAMRSSSGPVGRVIDLQYISKRVCRDGH